MAITIIPKTEIPIHPWQFKGSITFELSNDRNGYFDYYEIVVSKIKNKNEVTEVIYHLPQTLWSHHCSQNYLDEDSGISFYNEFKKREFEATHIFHEMYYSSESVTKKENIIKSFCQKSNEFPKKLAKVEILLTTKANKTDYDLHENQLKPQLQKNNCNLSQVKFGKDGINFADPDDTLFLFEIIRE